MNIGYYSFEEDCSLILGNFLSKYEFMEIKGEEEYTKYYKNYSWIVKISMISNFPYIGVSIDFSNTNGESTKISILNKALKIDEEKELSHYNEFKSNHEMTNYRNEMIYVKEVLEKFYYPILDGSFSYDDYRNYQINNNTNIPE